MYERMLNKQQKPTIEEMKAYCGENAALFVELNTWLSEKKKTSQELSFPYGHSYGWGITHRIKKKLVCHVFAEKDAFNVMMRLSNAQFAIAYEQVHAYTKEMIDHKYPCGDGGWLQYRVTCKADVDDSKVLLSIKTL